ncbi:MAG: trimeric intracellular cation channel family protein [Ruminococcaceae bacterium]|nr:trimeric intracellular cation channel family protein [Oscillospiraceae bacterium]
MHNSIFTLIEILGTISFSISGVITGMKRNLDIFGTVFLGIITAVGGGVIRDIILNQDIPAVFHDPTHATLATVVALIFLIPPIRKNITRKKRIYELTLLIMDSLGLGIFTVVGVRASLIAVPDGGILLHTFLGVITGVGGGVLRDVLSKNLPYIFTKHIYALASIAGALVCTLLWNIIGTIPAMLCGAGVIFILRCLAAYFQWNLPRISDNEPDKLTEEQKKSVYEPSITTRK